MSTNSLVDMLVNIDSAPQAGRTDDGALDAIAGYSGNR
jgi:hypothetical protein